MRFAVVGTGAIGGYFGAALGQAGHAVTYIARGRQLAALRENGLTILSGTGEALVKPVDATDDMSLVGQVDYVLICVKTWQLTDVLPALPLLGGPQTRYLTLQNGVEAPELVAGAAGADRVLAGLVRGFFVLERPAVIRHVGVQPAIIFGQVDGVRTAQAERLLDCLRNAGVYSELVDQIDVPLWEKFMLVASLSGVGAVTRSTIGEIRGDPHAWEMLRTVMMEIDALARKRSVPLPADSLARTLAFAGTFPPEATSSMQRDLMQGLPSELEAQTGAVVRMGEATGCPTPLNRFIYHSLVLQERRARATRA